MTRLTVVIGITNKEAPLDFITSARSTSSYIANTIDSANEYRVSNVMNSVDVCSGLLVDTGASTHVICDKNLFTKFEPGFKQSDNWLVLADGTR